MPGGIYCITGGPRNYIGRAANIANRFAKHICELRRFGIDVSMYSYTILEVIEPYNERLAKQREPVHIRAGENLGNAFLYGDRKAKQREYHRTSIYRLPV